MLASRKDFSRTLVAAVGLGLAFAGLAGPEGATVYRYDTRGNLVRVADTRTDPENCGAADAACSTSRITRACVAGVCAGVCASGYGDCNLNKRSDGCEQDLSYLTAHCGACGRVCNYSHMVNYSCTGGACVGGCATGFKDCNANLQVDGCETDIRTSALHCGACGAPCTPTNASSGSCSGGLCSFTCTAGWGNCDGAGANGCEAKLATDARNCGACGRVCAGTCKNGLCCAVNPCGSRTCSSTPVSDGCGGTVSCGACALGEVCSPTMGCYTPLPCFVAGTQVTLVDGSTIAIELLAPGDLVLSLDEATGATAEGTVVELLVHTDTPALVEINRSLVTTPEHRFMAGGAWTAARDLTLGTQLVAAGDGASVPGGSAVVYSLEARPGGVTTYNLEVRPAHNYFAGGVLVHNAKKLQ